MQFDVTITHGIAKYLNKNALPCYRIRLVYKVDGLDCHFYMRTLRNGRSVSPFRKCLTNHNEVSQKYTFSRVSTFLSHQSDIWIADEYDIRTRYSFYSQHEFLLSIWQRCHFRNRNFIYLFYCARLKRRPQYFGVDRTNTIVGLNPIQFD